MTSFTTTTRNAGLTDFVTLLRDNHARREDMVLGSMRFGVKDGDLIVKDGDTQLSEDGVTVRDARYIASDVFEGGVADKLGVPVKFLRGLRTSGRFDLYDQLVNGLLHGKSVRRATGVEVIHPEDPRNFMIRTYRADDDTDAPGLARALLSDKYGVVDNLDFTMAILDGIREAGVELSADNFSADVSDRRMFLRVSAPEIATLAPDLLRGYRSPYGGATGDENPTVFAGFVASNSEVGAGARSITPRLVVQVCSNGMQMTRDVMRAIHLGSRREEGQIDWSQDTLDKELDLVRAQTRDAVKKFLNVDYMRSAIAQLTEAAGIAITRPTDTLEHVGKQLRWSQEQQDSILGHFVKGGQLTAGGVLQAVTAYAQEVDNADTANDLEEQAIRAMELAAARH